MKYKLPIFILSVLLGACTQLMDTPFKPTKDGETVPVSLTLNVAATEDGMPGTRADIYHEPEDPAFDAEAAIKTVLLLQFDGQDMDAPFIGQQQYYDHWPLVAAQGEGFGLVARSTPQTVVVIANSFGYLPLTDGITLGNFLTRANYREIGSLDNIWRDVEDGSDNHHYLQMGGHCTFPSVTSSTSISLTLRRSCVKVVINVNNLAFDKSGDDKVIIEDVRMCGINAKHYYVTDFNTDSGDDFNFEDSFSPMNPMRFDAPEQTYPANDGSTHTFTYYLPANLRGLGANTDAFASQKGKNLGAPLGATCFRIYAHYGMDEEPVVYTYYLGGDLVNDFNLLPNTKYIYNITLTGKGTPQNDSRIEDLGDKLTFKVDANCYMLQPPSRADKELTYTIPVRRAAVFWNPLGVNNGVYGASAGDDEVLTLDEATPWTVSFLWNKIYTADHTLADEGELLVGSADDGSGNFVFTGKGFDPNYAGAAVAGHNPSFRIKVASGMKGDALVALRNTAGVILWSWHIWVTDYDPDVVITPVSGTYVYPVAGGALHRYAGTFWCSPQRYENVFIMDRNLGALSSWGEIDETCGAYYQFGRKDPEPVGVSVSYLDSEADVLKAIHNPTVHYTGWWTNTGLGSVENPWNDPELINGTGHGGDNCEPDKSIYDPCPPGWRVPVKDTWTEFTTSGCTEWFSSPAGRSYYPAGDAGKGRIWYPAGGYRYDHAANWDKVRTVGYSWSDSPQTENDALATQGVSFIFSQSEVMTGGSPRHCGLPVRCVRLR